MLRPPLDARSYNPKEPDRQQELRRSPESIAERTRASSLRGVCFGFTAFGVRVGPLIRKKFTHVVYVTSQQLRSEHSSGGTWCSSTMIAEHELEPDSEEAGGGEHPNQHVQVTHRLCAVNMGTTSAPSANSTRSFSMQRKSAGWLLSIFTASTTALQSLLHWNKLSVTDVGLASLDTGFNSFPSAVALVICHLDSARIAGELNRVIAEWSVWKRCKAPAAIDKVRASTRHTAVPFSHSRNPPREGEG